MPGIMESEQPLGQCCERKIVWQQCARQADVRGLSQGNHQDSARPDREPENKLRAVS